MLADRNIMPIVAIISILSACGGGQISEKLKRKSDRYYEAASISWYKEHNTLAAIRNLTRAVETNPENDEAHYLLGIIRFARGEYDEAETHLRKTMELRSEGDPSGLSGAQNNLGLLLIHKKRYREAIDMLQASANEVLNQEPWLAMGNLGWAYIEIGQYDKAIEVLRRALFEQPTFCVGVYRLGQAYYLQKKYESAEKFLKQSVSIPETGCGEMQEAHHLLGMTYLRTDKADLAKEAFARCIELNETSEVGASCAEASAGL
jgi:Tfp pilus assembly protein PilF